MHTFLRIPHVVQTLVSGIRQLFGRFNVKDIPEAWSDLLSDAAHFGGWQLQEINLKSTKRNKFMQ